VIQNERICALATPNGIGALGLIRLSGAGSIDLVAPHFSNRLMDAPSHTLHFGTFYSISKEPIDEVLVAVFAENKSFTGEESVEITAHGSPYILHEILNTLLASGCRIAEPGEFTMRAFLNGKMDLSQAEAVADLIASETQKAHQLALSQLKGNFSSQLNDLRTQLIHFASLIELEIDFSEEDVEFADRTELIQLLDEVITIVAGLEQSFELGNAIKKGVPVAIVGMPNVGKSTLLNHLLQEERSIVSQTAGTTRDAIEETLNIEGVLFRLIDTAGIRHDPKEEIEALGIQRSKQKLEQATIVLCIADATDQQTIRQARRWKDEWTGQFPNKKILILINKIDRQVPLFVSDELGISAKSGQNIDAVKQWMVDQLTTQKSLQSETIVSNVRHRDALTQTRTSLQRAKQSLQATISSDFVALDIRQAMYYLGTITGVITEDDLLENIFGKFCIGK